MNPAPGSPGEFRRSTRPGNSPVFNVYPTEVEEILNRHPRVAKAAVIGVPEDKLVRQ